MYLGKWRNARLRRFRRGSGTQTGQAVRIPLAAVAYVANTLTLAFNAVFTRAIVVNEAISAVERSFSWA